MLYEQRLTLSVMITIPTSPTWAEAKATDLVAEEVHHPTDLALHEIEIEQLETNGYQTEEI